MKSIAYSTNSSEKSAPEKMEYTKFSACGFEINEVQYHSVRSANITLL